MKKIIAPMILLFSRHFVFFWLLLATATATQAQDPQSRPFTVYERFVLESEMINQLQNVLNNYLEPSAYQLKLKVEGRMVADADGRSTGPKQIASNTQEDLITIFPGLPFYDAKRKVERPEEDPSSSALQSLEKVSQLRGGPEITKLRVTLLTDTSVTESEVTFYGELITAILRLDTLRGDALIWNQAIFPDFKPKAPVATNAQLAFDGDDALRVSLEGGTLLSQIRGLADAFKFGFIILLIIIVFIIVALIVFFKRRQRPVGTGISNGNRNAELLNDGQNSSKGNWPVAPQMSSESTEADSVEPKEEKLLKWLLHDQRRLGLLIEKFAREKGTVFLQQLAALLSQYRSQYAEMVCATLPDALRVELEAALKQPLLPSTLSEQALQLIDTLDEALEAYRRHGFFPFVLYLSDEELANLLQHEKAMNCWMVFDGLSADRQRRVMALLDAIKNAEMLSSYDKLAAIRYEQYELLSVSLFAHLVEKRSAQQASDQNIREIIQSIGSQLLERQEMIMEDLRSKNQSLYLELRQKIVLWSDLKSFSPNELQAATERFNSNELVELLQGDSAAQELLLPLRSAREQMLLKEQLLTQTVPARASEALRRQLLASLHPFWNKYTSSSASN